MPSLRRARGGIPVISLAAPQPMRRARLALVAGALFAASVLAFAGITLWYERNEELRRAERDLVNLGQTLSEQLAQRLEMIDMGLKAALGQLHDSAYTSGDASNSSRVLRAHAEALVSVSAIGLYGADGELVSASGDPSPWLPASLAAWDALAAHRSGRVSGLHISLPMRSPDQKEWYLLVSRRASDSRGEYRGAIVAILDPKRIAHAYAVLDLGTHTSLALLSGESTLIASHPWRDDLVARKFRDLDPGDADGGVHVSVQASIFDAGRVLTHSTPIRGYPLHLAIMKARRTILASWRRHAVIGGTAAVLISAMALALAFLVDKHLRRREESVAQLRENQADLTEAQRIARLGSWHFDGATGTIRWSAQAAGLLGIGVDSVPNVESLLAHVIEEDRLRVSRAWESLLSAGMLDVEFRTLSDTGETRWLRARAEAQTGTQKQAFRARGTLLDVTDERRAEQAAQHLAAIVESTEDAIFSLSGDGTILSWNRGAARMFGFASSESIGRRLTELLPPDAAAEAHRLVARGIGGEIVENFEIQLTANGQRRIHISVTLSPLRDAAGQVIAASAVARDITARRQAELRQLMEHRVAQLLAESAPLDETMPRILSTLCQSLGMDCGMQWDLEGEGSGYRRSFLWTRADLDARNIAAELPMVQATDGPCDLVWHTTLPQWFSHEELVARGMGASAGPLAFASALFIPIALGGRVACVLELRTARTQSYDFEILSTARAIGSQIGLYMERKRAEDDLRAEKEYIGHIIATAPTLIASIAPDGTTRSVNPTILDLAGYLPEELYARNFWKTLHEGPASIVDDLLTQAARGGVADYPLAIRTRSGDLRDLSVSAAARRGTDGSIVEYIVVGTDVTARRLDEARRAAEFAVARALSEAQSEPQAVETILGTICQILDWDCGVFRVSDPESRIVTCPYAWGKPDPDIAALITALQESRELGPHTMYWRTVDTGMPQWDNDLPSRIGKRLRPAVERAGVMSALSIPVTAGERFLGAIQFFGQSNNRPAGILLDAMQAIGRQIGQFIERKRVDAERQHADERLRSIAANIPGIVFEYRLRPNQTAAFEFVSERALDLLEEPADALTRDPRLMFKLVEPAYRRQLLRSMHVSRHTRSLWLSEMPIRTRSGRVRWVRGQSMPKYLDDGSVVWDGVIVDVTAQKQAEHAIQQLNEQLERRVVDRTAQLSAANRELESFAYSVSHDLRAPLRSIDGFSRILVEEYGATLDSTAANYLSRVRNASQRMGQLIDDLLSLSRVTRSELKRVRTDLSAIAEAVVQELRGESPDRSVSVSIHPGMSCLADPSLIRIALYNLIGNAWKFTSRRPDARIEFGALIQRSRTVYYVRDNGAGFDMEHAGKLFGAFQRLHSPREFEGTGVGLATVSRIIDRHGGTVWAESVVDQGATFYFTLGTAGGRS